MKAGDDVRERFLAAIAERVDPDAIAEVHLFQPMKQGGTESGVAVVAVEDPQAGRRDDAADAQRDAHHADGRLVVYTAKYRLTLKGPDRGKWEFAIQADADAPLITVDRVVQGVQRRTGDAVEPERLSGEEFRGALPPRETAHDRPS
jgi:hypothetical protein